MTLLDEIQGFLDGSIRESETKNRNIEVVMFYLGFSDASWPTLEETAERFEVGTRERIRQLIDESFWGDVEQEDLPSLVKIRDLVTSRRYWFLSELVREITESNLIGGSFNLQCLFGLMDRLEIPNEYVVYTPKLEQITRVSMHRHDEHFVIERSEVFPVQVLTR